MGASKRCSLDLLNQALWMSRLVQKKVKIALIFIAILALVAFCWFHSREPSYRGKTLSVWLHEAGKYGRNYEASNAADAVRKIGTNAIPNLVMMLGQQDSRTFSNVMTIWNRNIDRLPIWARSEGLYRKPADVLNYEAELGFEILGSRAESAVPALLKLYQQNVSRSSQQATAHALVAIGTNAQKQSFPFFLQSAASSNSAERFVAVWAISEMNENQSGLVAVLTNALTDANFMTRTIAIKRLARLGTNAGEAVPALIQLRNDKNRSIRFEAEEALNKIAPKAALKGARR